MQSQTALMDALNEFISQRLFRGDEAYLLTLMFKTLVGNDASVARQMNKVAEIVYSRILTRLIKRPNKTSLEQLPLWLSCPDWPVQKIDGISNADALANGGRHLHAMLFVPPNVRTGRRLSEIVEESPWHFLVGRVLTNLHVQPVEKTIDRATGYALKSVGRRRADWSDVLWLPKAHSEMGYATPQRPRRSETVAEFRARLISWSNATHDI